MSATLALHRSVIRTEVDGIKRGFIATPYYDSLFFIFAPLVALVIGIVISGTPFADADVEIFGKEAPLANIFIGTFIMAHLVIVFFRSHLNRQVYKLYQIGRASCRERV